MAVTYVDQVMAYLATDANRPAFNAAIGLPAFAGRSFTRRYGIEGYAVDSVALADPLDYAFQRLVDDQARLTGFTERHGASPERRWLDWTLHRQALVGWIDAAFTTQASMALSVMPGSLVLGPAADLVDDGTAIAVPPMSFRTNMLLGIDPDGFSLGYTLHVHVFLANTLSPTDDLRRIRQLRALLEADPAFLATLDGAPDQSPFAFVQVYPQDAADGAPLAPDAVAALFDQADVLAAFFTPPV